MGWSPGDIKYKRGTIGIEGRGTGNCVELAIHDEKDDKWFWVSIPIEEIDQFIKYIDYARKYVNGELGQ